MADNTIDGTSDLGSKQGLLISGLVSIMVHCSATGTLSQNPQPMMMLPTDKFDMQRDAVLEVARGIQCWE